MEKLENISIWKKIVFFIKKILGKNGVSLIDSPKEVNCTVKENSIEEMKKEYQILALQREYENGTIKEKELSKLEQEELLLLYKKQIKTLEENIVQHQKTLENYKAKIIEMKNKVVNNK